jgi:hypothetical protein
MQSCLALAYDSSCVPHGLLVLQLGLFGFRQLQSNVGIPTYVSTYGETPQMPDPVKWRRGLLVSCLFVLNVYMVVLPQPKHALL